jgi:hypothetical protein
MNIQMVKMIGLIILFTSLTVLATENTASAPYMGQEPPGLTPKVFAPGLISLPNRYENDLCLSQDGRECYFTVRNSGWTVYEIMVTRYENGQWTTPVRASFSDSQSLSPSLADNDQTLYFGRNHHIYRAHRGTQGWSQPEAVPAPISSAQDDWSCCISSLGNAWICSWRTNGVGQCDLWRIQSSGDQFTEAMNLRALNTSASDCNPVPGPAEDYVVFHSGRPGGFGGADLYIGFPDGQGGWTSPRNLGPTINTLRNDMVPYLSPNHRYLFFCREISGDSDIYWVCSEAFLPDPNGPVYNLSTSERFASIQTAINYAQSGQTILISPGTYKENLILPNTALTIRSANPQDSAVVSLTILSGSGTSAVVTLTPGNNLRSLQGLTITVGTDGIVCSASLLQVSCCVVTGNQDCGIKISDVSTAILEHCIVAGNAVSGIRSLPKSSGRAGIVFSKVDISNCTIAQNLQYGLQGDGINVKNSIIYANGASANAQINGNNVNVSYCDVKGGLVSGSGNIDTDPLFVHFGTWSDSKHVPGDYHLKSTAGHWNPWTCSWVLDDANSPCIDAGDPNSPLDFETLGQCGDVINMGAYGGTPEASRTTVE